MFVSHVLVQVLLQFVRAIAILTLVFVKTLGHGVTLLNLIANHLSFFICCERNLISLFGSFRLVLAPMPPFSNFEIKSFGANATFFDPVRIGVENPKKSVLSIG